MIKALGDQNAGEVKKLELQLHKESMLRETSRRFADEGIDSDPLVLVRADAAELPLRTGSVDAIHAGAALHCWPRLELSLAEVRRALKPDGRFYASTFSRMPCPRRRRHRPRALAPCASSKTRPSCARCSLAPASKTTESTCGGRGRRAPSSARRREMSVASLLHDLISKTD